MKLKTYAQIKDGKIVNTFVLDNELELHKFADGFDSVVCLDEDAAIDTTPPSEGEESPGDTVSLEGI